MSNFVTMFFIYTFLILRHLAKLVYNKCMKSKDSKTTKGRITKDSVFKELCKLDDEVSSTDLKRVRISTLKWLIKKLGG